jgi:hypothetical protein
VRSFGGIFQRPLCFGVESCPVAGRLGAGDDFCLSPYAQQEISTISAAIASYRLKLFAVPLDRDPRTHGEWSLEPDACPGPGGVFQDSWYTKGRTTVVLPDDLGHRPHHLPRLDVAPVHAICIGNREQEFSSFNEYRESPSAQRFPSGAEARGFTGDGRRGSKAAPFQTLYKSVLVT